MDTEEDYAILCLLFENLYVRNEFFDTKDIIRLFKEKPWIRLINKRVVQKKMFDTLDQEIAEALKIIGLNDLKRAKKAFEECLPRKRGQNRMIVAFSLILPFILQCLKWKEWIGKDSRVNYTLAGNGLFFDENFRKHIEILAREETRLAHRRSAIFLSPWAGVTPRV